MKFIIEFVLIFLLISIISCKSEDIDEELNSNVSLYLENIEEGDTIQLEDSINIIVGTSTINTELNEIVLSINEMEKAKTEKTTLEYLWKPNLLGVNTIKPLCKDDFNKSYSKEINVYVDSYVVAFLGKYEGVSSHWESIMGVKTSNSKQVIIETLQSKIDSTILMTTEYNNSGLKDTLSISISHDGKYFSSQGGGSTYRSLEITFIHDSILYKELRACGIPCMSGIEFSLPKNN